MDEWLSRFKRREGLRPRCLHGEGDAADLYARDELLETVWPQRKEEYPPEDIWNADESGFFFCALSDKTLTFKDDTKKGWKRIRERITALFCTSMVGEKKRVFIIGKSKHPRCFKNVRQLSVDYVDSS